MTNNRKQYGNPLLGLTFQFQPILAADGKRVLAFETLVRKSLRDGTIQGPGAIIPEAMHPNSIEIFTRFSLEFALDCLREDPFLPALSVNLSPRQVELAITGGVISSAPLDVRRRLIIELTEDPITDHPSLAAVLSGLASLGVRIFLDDIDYNWQQRCSALGRAVDGLKIDRNLLSSLAAQPLSSAARELLEFAADNDLMLIAEGVEDVDVLPCLSARGIAFFQGFALGEPWSEPKVARRHIVAPRRMSFPLDGEPVSAVSVLSSKTYSY